MNDSNSEKLATEKLDFKTKLAYGVGDLGPGITSKYCRIFSAAVLYQCSRYSCWFSWQYFNDW
jgi:hypothetical protein